MSNEQTSNKQTSNKQGGVCDLPRLEAQLERTAEQFAWVGEVTVFVNGVPLTELLSLR